MRVCIYLALLTIVFSGISGNAFAEEIKTTYSISSSAAIATTLVKKATAQKEELMRAYFFPVLVKHLRNLPMVSGIDYNADVKEEETVNTYSDYVELKRKYPVMVQLSLPASVTMMLKVEESYRKCKSPADKPATESPGSHYTPGGGGSSSSASADCSLQASVSIKGPYAVYGNFASAVNVENLLREKQNLTFTVARDYSDKTTLKIDSRFGIDSDLFERSLFRFMSAFNLSIKPPQQVDALGGDTSQNLFTRSNILLGIARILRVNNEKVVEL